MYTTYRTNLKLHESECRDMFGDWPNSRNGGYEYWQHCYITGPRTYAKSCTNRAIRAMYRDLLRGLDRECDDDARELWGDEIQAMTGSDYEKIYDYDWTIW